MTNLSVTESGFIKTDKLRTDMIAGSSLRGLLSEGRVVIQLSYGNVTTFDMGGQQGDVTQILSLIIIKGTHSTRRKCVSESDLLKLIRFLVFS